MMVPFLIKQSTNNVISANNEKNSSVKRINKGQELSTSWEFVRPLQIQDAEKEQPLEMAPPRFIEVQKGKISLGPAAAVVRQSYETSKDKEVLEARIMELEESLTQLQKRVNQTHCGSPTLEKDLREQLENMNRALRLKERRAMQTFRDHKILQARFQRQENCLQHLTSENKNLQQRVLQYECCLDDVMRKVVDAIVAEDNLRDEVTMLKNRVRDLEAQNAALSSSSPAKTGGGRGDEGYCTMSSGQQPPSAGHLEDLPEEPEQHLQLLLAAAEPCTAADMEDWSMSQEELGAALEEDSNEQDWLWHSSSFLNSTLDSQSESISQLLQDTIEYSDDEEIGCKNFTRDFYKLVNIASDSTRSLHSSSRCGISNGIIGGSIGGGSSGFIGTHRSGGSATACAYDTDDTDESSSRTDRPPGAISPTPSEAGLALVTSCSSSDNSSDQHTDGDSHTARNSVIIIKPPPRTDSLIQQQPLPPLPPLPTTTTMSPSSQSPQHNQHQHQHHNNHHLNNSDLPKLRHKLVKPNNGLNSFKVNGCNNSSNNIRISNNGYDDDDDDNTEIVNELATESVTQIDQDKFVVGTTQSMPTTNWRKSTGWKRVSSNHHIIESKSNNSIANKKDLKKPPPVPARRSYAS